MAKKTAAKKTAVGVEYIDAHKGLTTREFSHEVHGEEFADLAKQFAKKHDGRILKDGEEEEETEPETE